MKKRNFCVIIVEGDSTAGNPDLLYVAGTMLPRGGIYVKKLECDPLLIVSNIDVGNAVKGNVKNIQTYTDYGYEGLLLEDPQNAWLRLHDRILKEIDTKGNVGLYGRQSASNVIHLEEGLKALGYNVKGDGPPALLDTLRETKSGEEVNKIKNVGMKTERVVKRILKFLGERDAHNGALSYEGRVLKVGRVKRMILTFLAEENIMPVSDTIFAVGKGSADPHYSGEEDDVLLLNQPIVFDISPQDLNGYCFDCTRTFVIGRACREVKSMYETTLDCQQLALDSLKKGVIARDVMNMICERYEGRGYRTLRNLIKSDQEARVRGFIHSLGHGVGLSIGERPYLSLHSDYPLRKGHVITVEPGLYEPGLGGVRIEDVVVIENNLPTNLTTLEKVLEC